MDEQDIYLDAAAKNLRIAMNYLDIAKNRILQAYRGWDPGYPEPDSVDARAWDYLDAIHEAYETLYHNLTMWDKDNRSEVLKD